ncbi:hypothetical protein [Nonomuraea dietziae]|uniref:hypothetical protein n=1 Tax=Nonomuraea dietziae TaxID=65515 RepID=UPI00342FB2C2
MPDAKYMPAGPARRPRIPVNVCGEQVRITLMEARPAALTTRQLMIATGLSAYYVRKGLQWVKDKAALEHLTPLTWTPKKGYRFSADPRRLDQLRATPVPHRTHPDHPADHRDRRAACRRTPQRQVRQDHPGPA